MPITATGNAFAALIAELEQRLQLNGINQYLAFPQFVLNLSRDQMLFDPQQIQAMAGVDAAIAQQKTILNQEDFSVLVNMIPQTSALFVPDGRMLWSVYERAITTASLPVRDDPKVLEIAEAFGRYRADFLLAKRGGENEYYVTMTLPPNDLRDDNAWTRIALHQSDIRQLGNSASTQAQAWLSSRGLLDDVEKAGLAMTSLSVEVFPLSLLRPWLDTSVFTSRFWKWDDQPLSDGGDPPQGILPAYITRVIFARDLEIGLDIQHPANMAVAAQGISQKAMRQVSKAAVSIKHLTNLRSVAQPVTPTKAVNIRDFVAKSPPDKSGNRSVSKVGELSSAVSDFPVQPVFRCQPVLEKIATEIRAEQRELSRLVTENKALLDEIGRLEESIRQDEVTLQRYPPGLLQVEVRDHRGGKTTTRVINLQVIRNRLNVVQGELARKQAEQARNAEATRAQSDLIEELRGTQGHFQSISTSRFTSEDIFVLGFVCQRLPKSPDPDPQVFANP